jgi:outer membrane protein assembly factor BamB
MVRTDGIMGETGSQITWRWIPTAEQRLLAQAPDEPAAPPTAVEPAPTAAAASTTTVPSPVAAPTVPLATATTAAPAAATVSRASTMSAAEWPGFRGPARDGVIRGVRIATDWAASPPVAMWQRPIGPGWSSFAVRGDVLYTQEQRGDEEIVGSYRVSTGQPIWRHRDAARFWESNGGPGPRGTPTIDGDRVYSFGATGILNALDARTGAVAWSRDVAADSDTKVPMWGFASSPLVVGDLVAVAAAGRLAAYDRATGQPRWLGPPRGAGYSSPHLVTIDGVAQILLLSSAGATGVSPADGKILWTHDWSGGAIVQPGQLPNGDILINSIASTGGVGLRRLGVARDGDSWRVEERWTSTGLKPYFNDFVIHKGYAFGFDGSILSCIDLEDGKRAWKGGRYGSGQLVLLAEQDLLLVLAEEGELALVSATPDKFTEVARAPALTGKTWNHPVVVGNILLVRNGEEMAAFRLR